MSYFIAMALAGLAIQAFHTDQYTTAFGFALIALIVVIDGVGDAIKYRQ